MFKPTHDADAASILFNLPGYWVLSVHPEDDGHRQVLVESEAHEGACPSCGVLTVRVQARPTQRVKDLPWLARLVRGAGLRRKTPGSSALSQAFRRIGIGPLAELFDLVRGPAAEPPLRRGLLVCAIDGTTMFVPDSEANAGAFGRQSGRPDTPAGYPMLRLVNVVACGTRTVIDAVFGHYRTAETSYAPALASSLHPGMVLLGDRNFAATALIEQFAATGADLLIRCKTPAGFQVLEHLDD